MLSLTNLDHLSICRSCCSISNEWDKVLISTYTILGMTMSRCVLTDYPSIFHLGCGIRSTVWTGPLHLLHILFSYVFYWPLLLEPSLPSLYCSIISYTNAISLGSLNAQKLMTFWTADCEKMIFSVLFAIHIVILINKSEYYKIFSSSRLWAIIAPAINPSGLHLSQPDNLEMTHLFVNHSSIYAIITNPMVL